MTFLFASLQLDDGYQIEFSLWACVNRQGERRSLCTFVCLCMNVKVFFSLMSAHFYYSRFISLGTNTVWLSKYLCADRLRLNHGKNYVMQHQISGGLGPKATQTSLLINESFQYLSKLFTVMPREVQLMRRDSDRCHGTACDVMVKFGLACCKSLICDRWC